MKTIDSHLLRTLPLPVPDEGSKDERGAVLVVAGSTEVPGAALLAGVAALRAGAGRLKIATVRTAAALIGVAVPEAMVVSCKENARGGFSSRATPRLSKEAASCDAILIGPGMNPEGATTQLTLALLKSGGEKAIVLDAAALADLPDHAALLRKQTTPILITPHAGEMARLLRVTRQQVEADPLSAARQASTLLGVTVIMKGAQSFIVDRTDAAWAYEGGGVGLATSGSGDVLAGLLVGLLARGAAPTTAAMWAVFLHGEAGARLGRSVGPLGFLARELSAQVPDILRTVPTTSE